MMDNILVSVICITYNQEQYIKQCLDGFLMQKTNFPFEVIIHDDASTDGTADIIREYEKKYPDIIKPIYQTENQWSQKIPFMNKYMFPLVRGKYMAFCEGDDFWTDENKLQKQFDFMETNPEYTVCSHIVRKIFEPPILPENTLPESPCDIDYNDILLNDILLIKLYLHTSSYFLRSDIVNKFESPKGLKYGDTYILAFWAKYGKVKCIPEIMSVYRCNPNGIYYGNRMSSSNDIEFLNKICFDVMYQRRLLYENIAIDKELYFKEAYYPSFSNHLFMLLNSKEWKTSIVFLYKNISIYFLMLKHLRVMPYLICKDINKILKKIYKVLMKRTK